MAYTSIIPVRRLDRAVDYVRDKTKTTRNPKSLQDAVDYALNREKTESDCFETGLSCVCETAFEDMRDTVQRWQQADGVQGYHLVQSFAEGEVTPELAHQIGVELAEQLLKGRFQAVVTTHLNTKHYHNHIVWCSVALDNGRKYHSNAKSYYTEVRARSDALCRKYGLSIIETKESEQSSMPYHVWLDEQENRPNWTSMVRQDVNEAISQAMTWRQFLQYLSQKGYTFRFNRKYPTLQPPGKPRPIRFKTLGKQYTPEAIQQRILYSQKTYPAEPHVRHVRLHGTYQKARKLKGLRVFYYHETIFFGLNTRQFICSLLALGVAVGMYFLLRPLLGTEEIGWVCILAAAPFAACGFFSYHGMTAEQLFWAWLKSEILSPKRLVYHSNSYYYDAIQGGMRMKKPKQKKRSRKEKRH